MKNGKWKKFLSYYKPYKKIIVTINAPDIIDYFKYIFPFMI